MRAPTPSRSPLAGAVGTTILAEVGRTSAPGHVASMAVGDVNSDGLPEIVAFAENEIITLDTAGNPLASLASGYGSYLGTPPTYDHAFSMYVLRLATIGGQPAIVTRSPTSSEVYALPLDGRRIFTHRLRPRWATASRWPTSMQTVRMKCSSPSHRSSG